MPSIHDNLSLLDLSFKRSQDVRLIRPANLPSYRKIRGAIDTSDCSSIIVTRRETADFPAGKLHNEYGHATHYVVLKRTCAQAHPYAVHEAKFDKHARVTSARGIRGPLFAPLLGTCDGSAIRFVVVCPRPFTSRSVLIE